MSVEARKRLHAAHLRCRREVEKPDELTAQLLHSIRFEIDAEFARSLFGSRLRDDQQLMAETAVRWMEGHLHLRDPISRLCHYLQVSRSALDRVFDAVLHTTPAAHCLELRMQAAQKRLTEGKVSIKQIAYELGYKHPSNFGRAFKAFQRRAGRRN
jgi:transcriptional regulator GlxA family with amidase domain